MWFKTKIIKQMTATVCGVKVKDYRVKSLVIAENRDGKLVPVGNVSSGLSDKDKITLFNVLPQLAADAAGLYGNVKSDDVIWVKPVLKVIVSFIEREENGSLRHPVLVGFTDEKTE
ncbi:hypothetical protein [Thermoclostridium stercorarium]|nr:hypothetical protein [Thermoclostridium stercorarium]